VEVQAVCCQVQQQQAHAHAVRPHSCSCCCCGQCATAEVMLPPSTNSEQPTVISTACAYWSALYRFLPTRVPHSSTGSALAVLARVCVTKENVLRRLQYWHSVDTMFEALTMQ